MQSTVNNPTLKLGSQGQAVKELQELMNRRASRDYYLVVDGKFGPKTESLVKTFQRIYFLAIDGIVGPKTWKSLIADAPTDLPVLQQGSDSELVKRLQQALNEVNRQNKLAVDGKFGPKTEQAVKAYQQGSGAEVDRNGKVMVGPKTWKALSSTLAYLMFSM